MRNRPGATWWDIANELDLLICDKGPAGCPGGLSANAHHRGRVTRDGVFHWSYFNRRTTMRALYKFLVFAGFALHEEWRVQPKWLGLYNASRWAQAEAESRFKIRLHWEYSAGNRERVRVLARRAKVTLRRKNDKVFWWVNQVPQRVRMSRKEGAMDG